MANRRIDWDRQALRQFNKAVLYIAVVPNPERYPPDKYKDENDGNYRAFELHRLRVAYFVGRDVIRILRVRHTSREPQGY